ncbi:MAG: hypothetical protein PWQ59_227 [Thermoanaerobacterium sp.]|jgi:hypothetical protein|nr:hypothetical protein [Thermoanaerobacterium sp.]MDK2811799.1 hypothetical protein [Petrotoga sp.]
MKNLLYLAAGSYSHKIKVYNNLPFNLICLVDYSYRFRIKYEGKKRNILAIGMDVIDAIEYLNIENFKFDYLVILNEGLVEGGVLYPLHSDLILGYVMSILKDTYVHIMCPEYYKYFPFKRRLNLALDLPYEKTELKNGDKEYIDPSIFSNITDELEAKVYLMKKINRKKEMLFENGKKIYIIHDSFWNYYDELDLIVTFFKGRTKDRLINKFTKVRNCEYNNKIEFARQAVFECKKYNYSKIAFTAFGTKRGTYKTFFDFIKNFQEEYPEEFYFFHLNKNDYVEEYENNT